MGFVKRFLNQCAKPEGVLGRILLRGMNIEHAKLADWGIAQLAVEPPLEILDIGSGGGRHLHRLLTRYPQASGTAVDYAPLAVEKTARYNRKFVEAGRCVSRWGDVSNLPLPAEKFDLAIAVETVYFWPGLIPCFTQVARVVKPGGVFLIVNGTDGVSKIGRKFAEIIDLMTDYTAEQIEEALRAAGFSDVSVSRIGVFPGRRSPPKNNTARAKSDTVPLTKWKEANHGIS